MATREPDHLTLDEQFCFAVYSTAHALNRVYKPLLDRLGVTYPQYLVLLALWGEDDRSVGSLGAQLMLESSTLTPLLKRMETAGLLHRERSREDERQVNVKLTAKGRRLRQKAKGVPEAVLAATGCGARELAGLREEVTAVRDCLLNAVEAA